ncbi:HDIG domain-containing protein [Desulfovibrio sp. OttesenSCG-928-G11]|nr:HDIG domain-containing protein [Desulfovibrio sp. OttesenSCG-928-G11]
MTSTRQIPDKASSGLFLFWQRLDEKLPPKAFFLLLVAVVFLSAMATTDFAARGNPLAEGQIAPGDVVADRSFLFRDQAATMSRQEVARKMQPLIIDLNTARADMLHSRMQDLFLALNGASGAEDKEALRKTLSAEFDFEFSTAAMNSLASANVQKAVMEGLVPFVARRLYEGVLSDVSVARDYPGGLLIRNLAAGEESLQLQVFAISDIRGLELLISQQIRELSFSSQGKRALSLILSSLLAPTLVPDYEATRIQAQRLAEEVDQVTQRVQRGEVIIQKGDRVTLEQQQKMQVLLQGRSDRFHLKRFLGTALIGLCISMGLLFSPSAKPSTPMGNKDFIFLAVLLCLFTLLAKGLAMHGIQIAQSAQGFLPESLAFAVPVAGAAALSAQIFSARRYLVTGLLLAFFCTSMMDGGLALFLFYFTSCMWSTWLTNRSTSRREVVYSLLPLSGGLLALWAATTMIQGGDHTRYVPELTSVLMGGAFASMALTFALSPLVEMLFGYTTRFRLMELMNLEQPLLRDLMLSAPGTYHHSLIVSNMCEAGAKQVGAHSLLCKVAALYHDVGKVSKANYFIENQAPGDNPHDRLAPSMSALVLISHVKQGVEMASKHRLGREVTDIVRQHHGSSIIQYFYRKALNQTDAAPPNIEDFRYPGPKPQSREAAIVMLADIVEASSRALDDPSPTRLMQHIDSIMKNIYSAGQLDESELTFKDLHELADSFQRILRGLFHHRISYPGGAQPNPPKLNSPEGQKTARPGPAPDEKTDLAR